MSNRGFSQHSPHAAIKPVSGPSGSDASVIELSNLTLTYNRRPAVHHLNGCFNRGSLTAVVGPNGAGKSSLLKGIMGVLRPARGQILCRGAKRQDIAYLPQQAEVDRQFPMSVFDVVCSGHWQRLGLFRRLGVEQLEQAWEALVAVGLTGFERRPISSLSVGQFQRVLFARMLLQDAPIILLDEPFNAIDAKTTADLLGVVKRWHGEQRTIIAVLHDLDQVRKHFPDTLLLAREPIAWGPTTSTLTAENLLKARAMAEAWDDRAGVCERIAV
jgi:zinc/manganese transport system ATP-binding protein